MCSILQICYHQSWKQLLKWIETAESIVKKKCQHTWRLEIAGGFADSLPKARAGGQTGWCPKVPHKAEPVLWLWAGVLGRGLYLLAGRGFILVFTYKLGKESGTRGCPLPSTISPPAFLTSLELYFSVQLEYYLSSRHYILKTTFTN